MTDSTTTDVEQFVRRAGVFSDTLAKFEAPEDWETRAMIEDTVTRLLSIGMPESAATVRALQGAIETIYAAIIVSEGIDGNRTKAIRPYVSTFVDSKAIEDVAAGPVALDAAGIEKDPDNRTRKPGDVCDYCPTVGLEYGEADDDEPDSMDCPSCGWSWAVDPTATIGGDQ